MPQSWAQTGVPNRLLLPLAPVSSLASASFCTWNTRALLSSDPIVCKRKCNYLLSWVARYTYISLQETHGTQAILQEALRVVAMDFWIIPNFGPDQRAGGLITLIAKRIAPVFVDIIHTILVPGRVSRFCLCSGPNQLVFWNVHNYKLSQDYLNQIVLQLRADISDCSFAPTLKSVFAVGDFNFTGPGQNHIHYDRPSPNSVRNPVSPPHIREGEAKLAPVLSSLHEFLQPLPTHYWHTTNTGTQIDRIFGSIPPWAIPSCACTMEPLEDPAVLNAADVSDHSPTVLCFAISPPKPPELCPISRDICLHPLYHDLVDRYCKAVQIDKLHVVERIQVHKKIIRIAGIKTRNYLFDSNSADPKVLHQLFVSMARAVWTQNFKLARTLVERSALAKTHLSINVDNLSLHDPAAFHTEFMKHKHLIQTERQNEADNLSTHSASQASKKKSKQRALHRQAKLWFSSGRSSSLIGIRLTDGTVIREPSSISSLLASSWSEVFSSGTFDHARAESFLDLHATGYIGTGDSPPPTLREIQKFIRKVKHSAPGPDGFPYAAWNDQHEWGANTLFLFCLYLIGGSLPPLWFNESLTVFLIKGEEDEDLISGPVREAFQTRPLGLKNTDNKIITAVCTQQLRGAMQLSTHRTQNGFVPERQLAVNVVDLDAAARISSLHASDHNTFAHLDRYRHISILAFFDFAAAFPSLFHKWIFLVLRKRGLPGWYCNLISAIYWLASAYGFASGSKVFLFWYLAGVLQGCPASAFIFDMCLDPFLNAFQKAIGDHGRGVVRACADDIGAALQSHRSLKYMFPVFEEAEFCAGLSLKCVKCNIVPTSEICSENTQHTIKSWLLTYIPNWANFNIAAFAKYLGVLMGPSSAQAQWDSVIDKFLVTVNRIADAHASPNMSAHLYNTRAIPLLGYKAQFGPLPNEFPAIERRAMLKILHLAGNSLDTNGFFNLNSLNGPKIISCTAYTSAILMRAASKTLPSWRSWVHPLRTTADACLPLCFFREWVMFLAILGHSPHRAHPRIRLSRSLRLFNSS